MGDHVSSLASCLTRPWLPGSPRSRHTTRGEWTFRAVAGFDKRYGLSEPRELRAAHHTAEQARRAQPPPTPCAHGDPSGCTACSFCRRGLTDPGSERCARCAPPTALPVAVGG